jgi:hypothetical protein
MDYNMILVIGEPGGNWRSYRFFIPVSITRYEKIDSEIFLREAGYYRSKLGAMGWGLFTAILGIGGVKEVYIYSHSFVVFVHRGSSWEMVHSAVMLAIRQQLLLPCAKAVEIGGHDDSSELFHPHDSALGYLSLPQ